MKQLLPLLLFSVALLVQTVASQNWNSTTPLKSDKLRQCSSKLYIGLDRIFGGQDAQPNEFPHQASLQVRWLNSHVCGATLIADNFVLTAAHCMLRSRYPGNWQVKLGEHSLSKPDPTERLFNVVKVFVHEQYNPKNQLNDIALLKLEKKVDLTGADRHLKPVCLADAATFTVRTGQQATVVGWGKGDKGPRTTDVLQKLQQPLLDWQKCANAWKGIGWPVTEKNVCVGDLTSQKGVCSGDSGKLIFGSVHYNFPLITLSIIRRTRSGAPRFRRLASGGRHLVDYQLMHCARICSRLYARLLAPRLDSRQGQQQLAVTLRLYNKNVECQIVKSKAV